MNNEGPGSGKGGSGNPKRRCRPQSSANPQGHGKSSRRREIGDAHLFSPGSHAACNSGVSKKGECPQFRAARLLNLRLCRGPAQTRRRPEALPV